MNERVRLVLDAVPSAMLVVAPDGRIADLNGHAERFLGYERDELVDRPIELLVPDRFRGHHPGLRAEFHQDPRTRVIGHGRDVFARRKDGVELPVEIGLAVMPGDGGLVTCAMTDLSPRVRAEAERAALLVAEQAARERLSQLQHVTDAGLAHLSVDGLLAELLGRIREVLGGETATVLLLDPQSDTLVATASLGLEEELTSPMRIPVGSGVAGRVAASRHPLLISDLLDEEVYSPAIRSRGLRAMAAAPLIVEGAVIGVLHVASTVPGRFSADDLELLQLVADRVALAVDRARAFDRERSVAEALQRSLLPDRLPQIHGLTAAARYLAGSPGGKVGGDWYDMIPLADGTVGVVIGDVMGHGVRAAAIMNQLRHATRIYLGLPMSLPRVASELHRLVLELGEAEITTLLLARLDPYTGRLQWVRAGHPSPVVRPPDGRPFFLPHPPDPPLGAATVGEFACHSLDLERGTAVLAYTDGLIERRDESLDGALDRLAEVVAAAGPDAGVLCDRVLDELIGASTPADDVAVLGLQFAGSPLAPLTFDIEARPESVRLVRARLADWLERAGATPSERDDLLLAVTEALAGAADTARHDQWHVTARLDDDRVQIGAGARRPSEPPDGTDRGRALVIMEALVDELVIQRTEDGDEVRLSYCLARRRGRPSPPPAEP